MPTINDNFAISSKYISIVYVRSQGPGGQNVNKVNTKAQLTFDLKNCPILSEAVKKRLAVLAGRRITNQGKLIVRSDRYRQQKRNRQECLDRLGTLIRKALIPGKKRRATKPTQSSIKRRLDDKRQHSKTKSLRKRVDTQEG